MFACHVLFYYRSTSCVSAALATRLSTDYVQVSETLKSAYRDGLVRQI